MLCDNINEYLGIKYIGREIYLMHVKECHRLFSKSRNHPGLMAVCQKYSSHIGTRCFWLVNSPMDSAK